MLELTPALDLNPRHYEVRLCWRYLSCPPTIVCTTLLCNINQKAISFF
jgi:hypothetical protein